MSVRLGSSPPFLRFKFFSCSLHYLNVYADPKNKYLISVDGPKIDAVVKENKIHLIWGLLPDVKKGLDIFEKSDIVIHR